MVPPRHVVQVATKVATHRRAGNAEEAPPNGSGVRTAAFMFPLADRATRPRPGSAFVFRPCDATVARWP